jgi:hypothetical protein
VAALACMCGRPLGCKSFDENSDGRVDCEHVSGLLTRHDVRWPDGVRDPVPNNFAASRAGTLIGFSGSSVRPIVISFSSVTPASTHASDDDQRTPVLATRVIVTHAARAIPLLDHARGPVAARPPGVQRDRVRRSPARRRRTHCPVGCLATRPASRHISACSSTAAAIVSRVTSPRRLAGSHMPPARCRDVGEVLRAADRRARAARLAEVVRKAAI